MSMAAVLAYASDGSRARVMFRTQPGSYNDTSLIEFVRQLRRHFHADKVTLV
jgi:hypothetical protein